MSIARQFAIGLGRGVNIAPVNVRFAALEGDAEWQGLRRSGVRHVRLGGWLAEPLQNWSTCPASTVQLSNDEAGAARVRHGSRAPDSAAHETLASLRAAASGALKAGLWVVLNPFHQRFSVEVNANTLRWIWIAVLREFEERDFPVDRVAFEMVNEPANWPGHARVRGNWRELCRDWVRLVRATQPNRVLVLAGVQGWRGEPLHRPSLSSKDALLVDLVGMYDGGRSFLPVRECAERCIATFHYYEPRAFTTQSAQVDVAWQATAEATARLEDDFRLVNATAWPTPVYLGEFGLAVSDVANASDAAGWLRAVRQTAERLGVSAFAVWAYYGTRQGLVTGSHADLRICAWRSSALVAAALGISPGAEGSSIDCPPQDLATPPRPSPSPPLVRACPADGGRRPLWADAWLTSAAPTSPIGDDAQAALGDAAPWPAPASAPPLRTPHEAHNNTTPSWLVVASVVVDAAAAVLASCAAVRCAWRARLWGAQVAHRRTSVGHHARLQDEIPRPEIEAHTIGNGEVESVLMGQK